MSFTDQSRYRVRCEWGLQGLAAVGPSVDAVVIVDVLSFSTCVEIAVSRQAVVLPYQWKDDSAKEFAIARNALLAGKRCHAGDGLSLSPASLMQISPGTRLVLPSPNGSTLSSTAAAQAEHVVAGCLRNCEAVGRWAAQFDSVAVIPAGERWPDDSLRPAIEDLIGAGAIIRQLLQPCSPEARIAVAAYEHAATDLRAVIQESASGRELIERGFAADVDLSSLKNVSQCVPILVGDEYVSDRREVRNRR